MPYLILLVIILLLLALLLIHTVAAPSPHLILSPMEEPKDQTEKKEEGLLLPEPPAESRSLLVAAARYSADALNSFIAVTYRKTALAADSRLVGSSLLLTVPGTQRDMAPILCAVSLDVPASAQSKNFLSGGSMDGSCRANAMLEGMEAFLKSGKAPKRDIDLLFLRSREDLPAVTEALSARCDGYAAILCEGSRIAPFLKNEKNRIAAVGVSLRKKAAYRMEAGDADDSAAAILARALLRVEKRPFPAKLDPITRQFGRFCLYESSFFGRIAASSPRLFGPVLRLFLWRACGRDFLTGQAKVRRLSCENGKGDLELVCNVAPGVPLQDMEKQLRRRVRDDRIALRLSGSSTPNSRFHVEDPMFVAVQKAVALSFPRTNAAPCVLTDAPLARTLMPLSRCVFAFSPYSDDMLPEAQSVFFENYFRQFI